MSESKVLKSMQELITRWTTVTGISAREFKKDDLVNFPGDVYPNEWINSLAFVFMCHAEEYGAYHDDAVAAAYECYNNPVGETPLMPYMRLIDQVKQRDVGSCALDVVGPRKFTVALNARIEYWNNVFLTTYPLVDEKTAAKLGANAILQVRADDVACRLCLTEAMEARCGHAPEPEAMEAAVYSLVKRCYEEVVGDDELNHQMKDAIGRQQMLYGM